MSGARKNTAKKLPYKVLGKKLVDAHFKGASDPEDISVVKVRSEWPRDDERYRHAQQARQAALERKAREQAAEPESLTRRYVLK